MALRKASFSILVLLHLVLCVLSAPRKRKEPPCESSHRHGSSKHDIFLNPFNPFFTGQIILPSIFLNPPQDSVNMPNTENRPNTPYIGTEDSENNSFLPSDPPLIYHQTKLATKSQIKCKEYDKQISRALAQDLIAKFPSLFGSNTKGLEDGEGLCSPGRTVVAGGKPAIPGEFPHMVSLGKQPVNEDFCHFCGGTLIAPNWVLTAAHCTYGPNGTPNIARVGLHKLNDTTGQSLTIKRIIRHPTYKPPAMYGDIALVELNETITFSRKIRPACLYQSDSIDPQEAWVTGWGTNEFDDIELTNELQKANLTIINNTACSERHKGSLVVPRGIEPSMICAGDPRNNWSKDSCQGDSGGPLQVFHPNNPCVLQVVGVTSFGNGCAFFEAPGVYTRVSHFLNWIEEIVWPN